MTFLPALDLVITSAHSVGGGWATTENVGEPAREFVLLEDPDFSDDVE